MLARTAIFVMAHAAIVVATVAIGTASQDAPSITTASLTAAPL